ncbi:titin isoform X4 [Neocloeon triangulifer]|uniref:titin isoform X4 n=1 Tax=Neocloeon triangulifer TaxID=2078957 RepID=UPI00286F0347|nr:titin isoform X4 [Neocloeon triangulifer]
MEAPPCKSSASVRSGPKVAQIATIFQSMSPSKEVADPSIPPVVSPRTTSLESSGGSSTHSQSSQRFNVARALFERLGEQDSKPIVPPNKAEKLAVNTQLRGQPRPTNGHHYPEQPVREEKPMPPPHRVMPTSAPPPKPPKPEKPERKFSSKELIEKQRNWTAHFKNKGSSPRASFDRPHQGIRVPVLPTLGGTFPLEGPMERPYEKQDVPEKNDIAVITPTSPASINSETRSYHSMLSTTPTGTESSGDSLDTDKTLSELSETSPSALQQSSSSPVECQVIKRSEEKEEKIQSSQSYEEICKDVLNAKEGHVSPERRPTSDEEEEELNQLVAVHDKRKMVSSVQLVLETPASPVESPSSPVMEPAEADLEEKCEPPVEEEVPVVEAVQEIKFVDEEEEEDEAITEEVEEAVTEVEEAVTEEVEEAVTEEVEEAITEEVEEAITEEVEESQSEVSPEHSEATQSLQRELSSPENETPPTLPPKDMSPEVEELPSLPQVDSPKFQPQAKSEHVVRRPLPPSPEEEKLPELPESHVVPARRLPPEPLDEKPLPPIPRRNMPEFVESPPPLPPKDIPDIPEYAVPHKVKQQLKQQQEKERLEQLEAEKKAVAEPETMTPDEAENLLSSRIFAKRKETLLSDEQAEEVPRLIAKAEEVKATPSKVAPEPEEIIELIPTLIHEESHESTLPDTSLDYREPLNGSLSSESAGVADSLPATKFVTEKESAKPETIAAVEAPVQPEYVAVACREIFVENGIHYLEDGHFWVEVPGLPESDEEEEFDESVTVKPPSKVFFSSGPMRVYSTHSISDYDRRNDDVDPVAASAEYELEKRVEKMDVFPVELIKGPEGLGLSIIGMGVGADAGLEKLGIFVKTIADQGAAARDGRIHVNDQIIEVDGKSLVGVTQAYAASVLRNTSGLVKFLIGREKDAENSEVAQLIRQSLQADREREEVRRQHHEAIAMSQQSPGGESGSDTAQSPEGPIMRQQPSAAELEAMRQLVKESQYKLAVADADIARLKVRLAEQERQSGEEVSERLKQASQRLREMERGLQAAKKEVATYQDMLEQSQGQYTVLEKKYHKAKKLLREYQQREQDLLHREEFHLQLLQEKDTEYNALVKTLKDRIIQLEQELLDTQKAAGLTPQLPYDSNSIRQLTPKMGRKHSAQATKPLLEQLDTELSDTEISDCSPEETDKTSTVERKMPVKEELDKAVPPHELLDNSAFKSRVELVKGGSLAGRQLPSPNKKSPVNSSGSDYGLENSYHSTEEEEESFKAASETTISTSSSSSSQVSVERPSNLSIQSQPMYPRPMYSSTQAEQSYTAMQQSVYSSRGSYNTVPGKRSSGVGPPASLAEQLKQVLADRERRITTGEKKDMEQHKPSTISQTLVEEIRLAVQEANARIKRVPKLDPRDSTSSLSSCSSVPALRTSSSLDNSRSNLDDPGSPEQVWLSQEMLAVQQQEKRSSGHFWHTSSVSAWTKEQVCQWLVVLGLDHHTTSFYEHNVTGPELLMLESKEMKTLGVGGEDKNKLKRKLKELRLHEERERKQADKERKEKEKLQKKAEKLAEKASKIRK